MQRMKRIGLLLTVGSALALAGCYSSMPGNTSIAPTVSGLWMVTFTPTTQGAASTTFTVNFSQNGSTLSGTVTAVNNPASSCFPLVTQQSTFTVSGQAVSQSQSMSNLTLSLGFMSGSSNGTIMGTGALAYLGTMANGTFSFAGGSSGCTSGTFSMSQG